MAKATKLGRPPKRDRLRRSYRLQLLLTETEHRALNKYAERRQMTASEVMRGYLRELLEEQSKKEGKA
jgi:hypothetical protein